MQISTTGDSHLWLAVQYCWRSCTASCHKFHPPTFVSTNVLLLWHCALLAKVTRHIKELKDWGLRSLPQAGISGLFYTTEQFLKWFEFKHDIFPKQQVTYLVTAFGITPLKPTWILPRACNIHVAKFYYWWHVCMDQRLWNKGQPFDHQFLNW